MESGVTADITRIGTGSDKLFEVEARFGGLFISSCEPKLDYQVRIEVVYFLDRRYWLETRGAMRESFVLGSPSAPRVGTQRVVETAGIETHACA